MQREKIQLIRDGLETAYVNGNTASELLYKPNFVSNNHNEGKKVKRCEPKVSKEVFGSCRQWRKQTAENESPLVGFGAKPQER